MPNALRRTEPPERYLASLRCLDEVTERIQKAGHFGTGDHLGLRYFIEKMDMYM